MFPLREIHRTLYEFRRSGEHSRSVSVNKPSMSRSNVMSNCAQGPPGAARRRPGSLCEMWRKNKHCEQLGPSSDDLCSMIKVGSEKRGGTGNEALSWAGDYV